MNFFNARYIQSAVAFLLSSIPCHFWISVAMAIESRFKYMMLLFLNGFYLSASAQKRAVVDKRSLG